MIDVIIPAYNAHDTIGRTLASIAMQSIVDKLNVVIVDDCSDENYSKFVDIYSQVMDIEEIRMEVNSGPGAARQTGMNETDGDFIVFIDADDTFESANSLSLLEREIMAGYDVVVGQFVEELENGTYLVHGENMVWMFAKMYRRSFLERHLIRMNDTRANEDTGFNTLVQAMTGHIRFVPQIVYMWHFRKQSITRANNGAYASAAGHVGYIENMIWAINEMCSRNLNKEIIRNNVVKIMSRLYFMHMSICYSNPMDVDDSEEAIRQYYQICYKPIEQYIPNVYLQETFIDEQVRYEKNMSRIIPVMTFNEFMREMRKESEVVQDACDDG